VRSDHAENRKAALAAFALEDFLAQEAGDLGSISTSQDPGRRVGGVVTERDTGIKNR
jgi:hypothetical protein